MPKAIAVIIESAILLCALWTVSFLSTFLHEFGHALGYMLATGDRQWHIRVGWGKKLLNSRRLTVNLFVFDGCFDPAEGRMKTKAHGVATLLGGPIVSLLLVAGLWCLISGGISVQTGILADGVIEFFVDLAFYINLFTLLLSLLPIHYFHGQVKGMETDGLKILRIIKS